MATLTNLLLYLRRSSSKNPSLLVFRSIEARSGVAIMSADSARRDYQGHMNETIMYVELIRKRMCGRLMSNLILCTVNTRNKILLLAQVWKRRIARKILFWQASFKILEAVKGKSGCFSTSDQEANAVNIAQILSLK